MKTKDVLQQLSYVPQLLPWHVLLDLFCIIEFGYMKNHSGLAEIQVPEWNMIKEGIYCNGKL